MSVFRYSACTSSSTSGPQFLKCILGVCSNIPRTMLPDVLSSNCRQLFDLPRICLRCARQRAQELFWRHFPISTYFPYLDAAALLERQFMVLGSCVPRASKLHEQFCQYFPIFLRHLASAGTDCQLLDLHPMYLLHAPPKLQEQFRKYFDPYGDPFYEESSAGASLF